MSGNATYQELTLHVTSMRRVRVVTLAKVSQADILHRIPAAKIRRKKSWSDMVDEMKCRLLSLVLVIISLTTLVGCVARRTKAALLSYERVLKPGMTRKDVEDYLRANKIPFHQQCCLVAHRRDPLEDFISIGTAHYPVPCGDESYFVVFLFNDQTEQATNSKANDFDTLQSITTFSSVDCF